MTEEVPIARVTMQWPQDLKDRTSEVAGGRKLTQYVMEAVEAKLEGQSANEVIRKELWEVKFLCQQLADALALSGDYEDRISTLRAMDLPSWIQTSGWTEEAAEVVPVEKPDIRELLERDVPPAPAPAPVVPAPAPVVPKKKVAARSENDLFQRLQAKAKEKGVDVSGIDLRPASEVRKLSSKERAAKGVQSAFRPEPDGADDTERIELEPLPLPDETPEPQEPAVKPTEAPLTAPARCSACRDELIDGECWTCM